jgi:tetratricopeptide (TPR) repeat protein
VQFALFTGAFSLMYGSEMLRVVITSVLVLASAGANAQERCGKALDQAAVGDCTKMLLSSFLPPQSQATIYFHRGSAHLEMKHYNEAIDDFTIGINTYPWPQIYVARGNAYFARGDIYPAYVDYQTAFSKNPMDMKAKEGVERATARLYQPSNNSVPWLSGSLFAIFSFVLAVAFYFIGRLRRQLHGLKIAPAINRTES